PGPMRTRTRWTASARCAATTPRICSNIAITRLYSCIARLRGSGVRAGRKARRPLVEERAQALRELRTLSGARQFPQLAIEMRVELIHPGRLIEQLLCDGDRARRSFRQARGH